jgi:trigger factor
VDVLIHSDTDVEHQIEIVLSAEDLKPHFDAAYAEQARKIEMKGYRRGHVPMAIIRKRFGPAIEAEAIEKIANDSFQKALEERDIKPFAQPVMEDMDYQPGGALTVKIRYETMPEITLGDYAGIQLERLTHETTGEEVEEELRHLLNRHRSFEDAEKADEEGYLVTCDIQLLDAEGAPIEGKKNENVRIDLGDEHVNRDLKAELLNMRAGEEKDVELPFETKDGEEEVDRAHITVHTIERIILPELDDAFAAKATNGQIATVDALRDDIRSQLVAFWKNRYEDKLQNDLVTEILQRHPFAIPPTITDSVLDDFVKQVKNRSQDKELPPSFDEKEYRAARKPEAEAVAKWALLRESIIEKEKLAVADADLEAKALADSIRLGIDRERLQAFYLSNDQVRKDLIVEKLITHLVSISDVRDMADTDVARTPLAPFAEPEPQPEPEPEPEPEPLSEPPADEVGEKRDS